MLALFFGYSKIVHVDAVQPIMMFNIVDPNILYTWEESVQVYTVTFLEIDSILKK